MESFFSHLAIEALWPHFCLICGQEGAVLCDQCKNHYRPQIPKLACPFCGQKGSNLTCWLCREQTYLDGLITLSNYGDPVIRKAIGLWKYYGDQEAYQVIVAWIKLLMQNQNLSSLAEVVSYIPLHWSKKK